ncbi:hypothetical protein DPMN_026007 [Dreissena polymorpha]|uniref:Uncharacterized protein n=1 Tax=Dreissena polymorpha TaxID=45954 RepID=A0A9D4LS38_DREPO|nr:hypothetical protein DPMN_026007 [Dreissena polymorpha]
MLWFKRSKTGATFSTKATRERSPAGRKRKERQIQQRACKCYKSDHTRRYEEGYQTFEARKSSGPCKFTNGLTNTSAIQPSRR